MASAKGQTIRLAGLIDNTASITRHDPGFTRVHMREMQEPPGVLTRGDRNLRRQAVTLAVQYFQQGWKDRSFW
ncbi:hypothetical protein [Komagataeibacter europaeus]|uniref:hypothetical protein n=1 Tax=Komagataeibacter europaeus TaxID=33995 RepID=UPI000B56FBAE|nr:hypothetical protein [Komagataeibacter europaeus]ARW15828.1 hypothetical protein S101446_00688 [Komagataeibacter europaeus]